MRVPPTPSPGVLDTFGHLGAPSEAAGEPDGAPRGGRPGGRRSPTRTRCARVGLTRWRVDQCRPRRPPPPPPPRCPPDGAAPRLCEPPDCWVIPVVPRRG